jgi:nicotinamidase/pyrazinamidase
MACFAENKPKIKLLIIDPQNDFHPGGLVQANISQLIGLFVCLFVVGSLGVPGAIEDSERTAAFIRRHIRDIDEIYVSLDSHHVRFSFICSDPYLGQKLHIAHGGFWKNANNESPAPFTLIKSQDIVDGTWTPRNEAYLEWSKTYTKALEDKGRFVLCIWPEHCLVLFSHSPLCDTPLSFVDRDQWSQCLSPCERSSPRVGRIQS